MGSLQGGTGSDIGGLVGDNAEESTISQSYSIGAVKEIIHEKGDGYKGGFAGYDGSQGGMSSDYWDISTSHVRNPSRGAGWPKHDPGITGVTTEQLQSGLPAGFDPTIWAENPKINDGLPYLIANPPRK
jgi:hypothetical protein